MRTHIKNNILELIHSVLQIHDFLSADLTKYNEFSPLCVSAVQSIQNSLNSGENAAALDISNEYIKAACSLDNKNTKDMNDLIYLNEIAKKLLQAIEQTKTRKHVVFFPYNASMWDSLESIYFACKEDENCECYVVPIPYSKFNASAEQWNEVYEGALFPKEIPITNYSTYSLEKNLPDIAYIHNPYDEYNYVTRVHENYFSYNLKKFVNLLVYVPYYVNSGHGGAKSKLNLPSYHHMDYIIVQSNKDYETFGKTPFKEKVVALGSPKFDKIVKQSSTGGEMPPEWKEKIAGRKTLMLNLTIATLLSWREAALRKLKALFSYAKDSEVAIIWRPHPLLQSTIDSMLPYLQDEYASLVNYFVTSNAGVLDTTPDITNTIALSNGYIGCESSVVSLFRAAKKPIFLLYYDDNHFKTDVLSTGVLCEDDKSYFFPLDFNTAYLQTNKNLEYEKLIWIENEDLLYSCGYNSVLCDGTNLYTSYLQSDNILCYHRESEDVQNVTLADLSLYGFVQIEKHGNKFICIPYSENHILIYNAKTNNYKKNTKAIEDFKKDSDSRLSNAPTIAFTQKNGNILYMGSHDTGNILQYNMQTNEHNVIKIAEIGFSCGFFENGVLWLAQVITGDVFSYDTTSKKICVYKMPQNLKQNEKTFNSYIVHRYLFKKENTLITLPWAAHCMVKVDVDKNTSSFFMEDYFVQIHSKNSIMPMTGFASQTQKGTIIAQRMSDFQQFEIDLQQETMNEFEIKIPKQELEQLKNKHIQNVKKHCYIRETGFFTAEDFISSFSKENYMFSETIKSQNDFANNLDGTCGEKTHALLMEKLNEQS